MNIISAMVPRRINMRDVEKGKTEMKQAPLIPCWARAGLIAIFLTFGVAAWGGDTSSQMGEQTNRDQGRFRFCTGVGDGCTYPGNGYTACERFLQMLNDLLPTEPPPVCELKLPPGFTDFALPEWEEMPAAENMRLIYDMEMYLVPSSVQRAVPPEWVQYFPYEYWAKLRRDWDPTTWRRVPYELWLEHYQSMMRKGEIVPRLRRTRAILNENGPENLIAYERLPGGDIGQCQRSLAAYGSANGGSHVFLLTPDPLQPVRALLGHAGSHSKSILVLRQGKAYFGFTDVWVNKSQHDWFLSLHVAMPLLPAHLEPDRWRYVTTQRCAFKLNEQP